MPVLVLVPVLVVRGGNQLAFAVFAAAFAVAALAVVLRTRRLALVATYLAAALAVLLPRLVAAGATRVDVGQDPSVSWTVLADPEVNEFCVLSSRDA